MREWQERTELLLNQEIIGQLNDAHVLIVGLGGVGGYAAEMLGRAGIGELTIVDADVISTTNINRQLIALHSTIGQSKAAVLESRLVDINPEIKIHTIAKYIDCESFASLFEGQKFDYVIDAIDTIAPKVALIKECLDRNIPLVSSMGAGSKLDPSKIEVSDISKSHHCPLAHMLRKRLSKLDIRTGFQVVFSAEPPREGSMILCEERNKKSNVGTISYMPPIFGIFCASVVIRALIGDDKFNMKP